MGKFRAGQADIAGSISQNKQYPKTLKLSTSQCQSLQILWPESVDQNVEKKKGQPQAKMKCCITVVVRHGFQLRSDPRINGAQIRSRTLCLSQDASKSWKLVLLKASRFATGLPSIQMFQEVLFSFQYVEITRSKTKISKGEKTILSCGALGLVAPSPGAAGRVQHWGPSVA